ncbi:Two pore calcium channel protein 1 [Nymphon striatum]|nr:Two pore calcium channel protein 1 [Nymphon striatum]
MDISENPNLTPSNSNISPVDEYIRQLATTSSKNNDIIDEDESRKRLRYEKRSHSVHHKRSRLSWFNEYVPSSNFSSRHRSYSCQLTKEDILGPTDETEQPNGRNSVSYSKTADQVNVGLPDSPIIKDSIPSIEPSISFEDLLVAATLVNDAKFGRHTDFVLTESCARLYIMFHHWVLKNLLYFFVLVNLALALFEKPAVPGLELPYWVTMIMEFSSLLFYVFRFIHGSSFIRPVVFWSDKKNIILLGTIVITFIDIIQYVAVVNSGGDYHTIRFSRCLRPIFLVNIHEGRQIRRAFRNIRRTLPDILNALILFFLTIALFALLALKLYRKDNLYYANGRPYFQNYFDSYFDLYVLVTTANDPDVMMPAYDLKRWNALFFVAFLIIALYIFMSIILAVIYNNYRKHLKNEVKSSVLNKRKSLSTAFDILKVNQEGHYILPFKRFNALLKEIPPVRSLTMKHILWFVLDGDGDFQIGKADFMKLADLLNVNVSEVQDRKPFSETCFPTLFYSRISTFIRYIVKLPYFFDLLIVINAILIGVDKNQAEWFFLAFFALEIVLKIYTFGLYDFFTKFWNKFDFFVIGAAIIATIVESFMNDKATKESSTLDIILVLRVLRLVKIVGGIERFKVIVVTIGNLGPSMLTYGSILFIFYYGFAMVGMELFHGKIKYNAYDESNHTDPKDSIFTAFVLEAFIIEYSFSKGKLESAIETKIHELGLGLGTLAHKKRMSKSKKGDKKELLDAMEEHDPHLDSDHTPNLPEDRIDSEQENKDDDDHLALPDLSKDVDIRFHLKKGKKNVEVMLQRMFENEIEEEDIIDEFNIKEIEERVERKLTLSMDA